MKHVFLIPMVVALGYNPKFRVVDSIRALGNETDFRLVFYLPLKPLGSALSESVHAFGFDPDTFITIVNEGDGVDKNYLRCCEEVLQAHPDCTCIVGRVKPMSTPSSEIRKIRAEDIDFRSNPPITFQVGENLILPTQATPQNLMKNWLKGRNPEHFHIYSAPNAVIYRS